MGVLANGRSPLLGRLLHTLAPPPPRVNSQRPPGPNSTSSAPPAKLCEWASPPGAAVEKGAGSDCTRSSVANSRASLSVPSACCATS